MLVRRCACKLLQPATAAPTFVNDDGPSSFDYRRHDRLIVERPQRPQIDHFSFDIVGGERSGGVQRLPQRAAIGDERNILPNAANLSLVDVDRAGVGGELAGHVVQHHVLEDQHRVGIFERRPKHSARVWDGRRSHHLNAGNMRIPSFKAMRMLSGDLASCTGRQADDHGHTELVARHVANGCGVVENLVQRQQAEIHRHQLHDRAHARHGGADAGAGEAGF